MKGIWYDTRFTTSTAKEEDKAEYIGGEVKGGEVKPGFFMHEFEISTKEETNVKPTGRCEECGRIVKIFKAEVVGHNISGAGETVLEYALPLGTPAATIFRRLVCPYMPELALGIWVDVEISLPPEPDSQEYEPLLTRGP